MDYAFRSALHGFNRGDVVTYLQNMTEAHKGALLDARRRRPGQGGGVPPPGGAGRAEGQLTAQPSAEPETPDLQRQELEAYRRREAAERTAAAKAEKIEAEALSRPRPWNGRPPGRRRQGGRPLRGAGLLRRPAGGQ